MSVPGLIVFGAHSAALVRLGFSVKTSIAQRPIAVQIFADRESAYVGASRETDLRNIHEVGANRHN